MQPNPTALSPSTSAGAISRYYDNWKKVTSNNFILRIVREGYKIQFNKIPHQKLPIISTCHSSEKHSALIEQIASNLTLGAISESDFSNDQYVSRVFTVKKSNGKNRMIIDLSDLNNCVSKVSFRMEGIDTIKSLIEHGDFVASIDLSDAFFTIPLHSDSKKFTTFQFDQKRYSYNVLPFGLTSSPRIFSKMLKPAIIFLRSSGVKISSYLDDIFICGSTKDLVSSHVQKTLSLLHSLGFRTNFDKSQIKPCQSLKHLGFIWNTLEMTLSVPLDKITKANCFANSLISKESITLTEASSFIGFVVSLIPGFPFSPLYFRMIQYQFINIFKNSSSWSDTFLLNDKSLNDLSWWSKCSSLAHSPIKSLAFDVILHTDSSLSGWGAHLSSGEIASNEWSDSDSILHINLLELLAIKNALNCFLSTIENKKVKLFTDNVSAMHYINKIGGTHSHSMCIISLDIWKFCLRHNIYLSAFFIASRDNVLADSLSRFDSPIHDYMLASDAFDDLINHFQVFPEIDLFASTRSAKLDKFVSLNMEQQAWKHDAFSFSWNNIMYMFPPINLIGKTVSKFLEDQVNLAILITPEWYGLPDIPIICNLLISDPVLLPAACLRGERPTRHPFNILGWLISADAARQQAYLDLRQTRCSKASHLTPLNPTSYTGKSSVYGLQARGIHLVYLYQ